jgi:hypothetical protein
LHPSPNTIGEINPLNAKLNPISHLLALLGAHHILHTGTVRVKMKEVELGGACGTSGGEQNFILRHEGLKPLRRHNRRLPSAIVSSYVCDNIKI